MGAVVSDFWRSSYRQLKEALDKAKEAEVILFIGGLNKELFQDCESEDRITYDLPYKQNELIEKLYNVNKKCRDYLNKRQCSSYAMD